MRIVIRLDCNEKVGMGHFYRQFFVYKELERRGHAVHFKIEEGQDFASKWNIPLCFDGYEGVDLLIIDLMHDYQDIPRKSVGARLRRVVFHDSAVKTVCNSDIVFALNPRQKSEWYNNEFYYLGPQYFPMDPSINKVSEKRRFKSSISKILIATGGVDNWDIPGKTIKAISELDVDIIVKISDAYPKERRNYLRSIETKGSVIFVDKIDQISDLYSWADFMIGTAGNVLFEAAAASLPCATYSVNQLQKNHSVFFDQRGFSIDLGGFWNGTANSDKTLRSILDSQSPVIRYDRAKKGKNICDGLGLKRSVDIIEKFLNTVF